MNRRYYLAAAAALFLQGPAAWAGFEEAPDAASIQTPASIAAVPDFSAMNLQLGGEAIGPADLGGAPLAKTALAATDASWHSIHRLTKVGFAHALTATASTIKKIRTPAAKASFAAPAEAENASKERFLPASTGRDIPRPALNPLQELFQDARQDANSVANGQTDSESAAAQAGTAFDGIPSGTFDPRVKWSLLTTWSKDAIGPSLFKDIEHPDTRQVDAAVFDFTNFRVGEKRISDVLQQLKARPGSRLRVVAGYDQAMHNENSLWPQVKSMADDAHLLSGLRSDPGSGVKAPDRQGLMHVKLWIIRRADGARVVYAGSANASNAALGGMPRNHEIMLRLEIPAAVAQSSMADSFTTAFEQLLARAKQFEASLGRQH
ncbi:MAG TPA: hypothetical protein VNK24_03025 [Elusimicrobiota bacterium]|nr:hypothetical protein [Elusimicrobiota bacterium]